MSYSYRKRYCPEVLIALLLYFRFEGRMGEEDKFCLKWNDFQDNIARAHRDLRTDRFACDDQHFLKTVVISGISMMFLSSVEVKLSRHIV